MQPPPSTKELLSTHIFEGAVRQLAVPLILNFGDLSCALVIEDVNLTVNGLLLVDALDDISRTHVQANRISSSSNFVV